MASAYGVRHYTLTLTGAEQLLSTVLDPAEGQPSFVAVSLQPGKDNANPIYIGGVNASVAIDGTSHGIRLPAADGSGNPPAPWPLATGGKPMRLNQFKVIGTLNELVHLLCVEL